MEKHIPELIANQKIEAILPYDIFIIGYGGETLQCNVDNISSISTNPGFSCHPEKEKEPFGYYMHVTLHTGSEFYGGGMISLWAENQSILDAWRDQINMIRRNVSMSKVREKSSS